MKFQRNPRRRDKNLIFTLFLKQNNLSSNNLQFVIPNLITLFETEK